jgi:hypothetical protein
VLHGANEAFRTKFRAARPRGMCRMRTGIGVDTSGRSMSRRNLRE